MEEKTHYIHLKRAIELSQKAKSLGDGPFGAVITDQNGEVIAEGLNTTSQDGSVIFHAEINAIRNAESVLGKGKLKGCTLYSSAEPCPMCTSAIIWSGISTLYFGASIPNLEKLGIGQIPISCKSLIAESGSEIEVTGPLLEDESILVFK